ncbi:MAG TPA: methyltransferase domain-containing protein [Candidatus Saccharimonadaceae bacterium]|jgi:rhodanese-related sulfurtransferase|nr:methyltransferase domain-containing protein [Candidatus Saccharimonadaceae bacterium]
MRALSGAEAAARVARAEIPLDALDVRDAAAFEKGHWPGSGHVPRAELEARRAELPPPGREILVLGADGREAGEAARAIVDMGWPAARIFFLDDAAGALAEAGAAWGVGAARRLWRPAPFLEDALRRHRTLVPEGPAIDVACGAGRDAVWLALQGFAVEAWDRDAWALGQAERLAARHGVALATVPCDLEWDAARLPEARFALVTCFRFLHRPLFARLAAALLPGGVLVYETYRLGQERFGRPKSPRFLLEAGELSAAFSSLEVLEADEPSPPEGPITARLVARRPAAP